MNIVQTYYSYSKTGNAIYDKAGFLSPDMNWKSMALSCLLLKKHFKKVTLYCNKRVIDLVVNEFKIPYDNIVEIPEFMSTYEGCNLWALPKIYTYGLQTEPFLHVDCDWFMFDKLSPEVMSKDIIGQNIEYDDQLANRKSLEKLISNDCIIYPWVIDEYEKEPILRLINAGILGGNDISFIQNYVKIIHEFIANNYCILKEMNDGYVNSIYEQLFIYILAKKENKTIGLCTLGDRLSTNFNWLQVDTSFSPKCGYMHLLANLKRRIKTYVFVSDYLNHIDSNLNYRISKCCNKYGIEPLIDYPQWNIYSSETKLRVNSLENRSLNISQLPSCEGYSNNEINITIGMLERMLYKDPTKIYYSLEKNAIQLWEINSLWDERFKFSLNPNIVVYKCSRLENDVIMQDNNCNKDKSYLILVPNATLMRVMKIIISGIKADICELLFNKQAISIGSMSMNLYPNVNFTLEENKSFLDKFLRSMIVSGIIKLDLK